MSNPAVTAQAAMETMCGSPPGQLGVEVFAAARPGDELRAVGTPLHLGRRTQAWEVRVQARGRLAALSTCTQMLLDPRRP